MTLLTTHNPIRPLPEGTASELMRIFIDQDTDALLVGACLALLAQRVPEAHELAAFADALSEVAVPFPAVPAGAIDVVGTGGDGASTANLSTLSALLLPHLGVPVVKHGNRAATGVCGSADLMEASPRTWSAGTSPSSSPRPSTHCWAACGRSAGAWASPRSSISWVRS